MNPLDYQDVYWDKVAQQKDFTHPLLIDRFREFVSPESLILDYGCGYGRTCAFLEENGFQHVIGVDISSKMISRGLFRDSSLDLRHLETQTLPFADNTFDACTLLAVLNCIPTDSGQQFIIKEIHRVLHTGGVLYLSDYSLQQDDKNIGRYKRFEEQFDKFGVFQLPDGAVLRHHDMGWIDLLLGGFDTVWKENMKVLTMNGNKACIFQIMAAKT